jgi:hypothetical protein
MAGSAVGKPELHSANASKNAYLLLSSVESTRRLGVSRVRDEVRQYQGVWPRLWEQQVEMGAGPDPACRRQRGLLDTPPALD